MSNGAHDEVLTAPARIVSETRSAFRTEAMAYLDRAAALQSGIASLDLSRTEEIDAAGLGILVLMQKRSEELKIQLRLLNASASVKHLLRLTRLEHLFQVVD